MTSRPARAGLLVVALTASLAASGQAQSTEEMLAQRRLEYTAALDANQSARSAFEVVEQQFNTAITAVDNAKRSGDQNRHQQALSIAYELSLPVAERRGRLDETADAVATARAALIEILVVWEQELLAMTDAAGTQAEFVQLDAVRRDVTNELTTLEEEAERPAALEEPIAMLNIGFDPRDGPEELRAKAEILERQAARVDTLIIDLDREIDSLTDRLQRERQRQDFLAATGRFGDRNPLTGTTASGDPGVQAADSAGVGGQPRSLEERITERRALREVFVDRAEQLRIRAELFRRRNGSSG